MKMENRMKYKKGFVVSLVSLFVLMMLTTLYVSVGVLFKLVGIVDIGWWPMLKWPVVVMCLYTAITIIGYVGLFGYCYLRYLKVQGNKDYEGEGETVWFCVCIELSKVLTNVEELMAENDREIKERMKCEEEFDSHSQCVPSTVRR